MEFLISFMELFPQMTTFQTILLIIILIPTGIALIWGAPWVPTPKNRIHKMLELAKLKPGEKLYDLGCGDGRMVHIASRKHKVNAIGLELSPLIYAWAKLTQPWHILRGSRAKIKYRNMYQTNLSDADVIAFYLMPHALKRMAPKFKKELKKGTRIVSYAFQMPDDWKPTHQEPRIPEKKYSPIWVYTI